MKLLRRNQNQKETAKVKVKIEKEKKFNQQSQCQKKIRMNLFLLFLMKLKVMVLVKVWHSLFHSFSRSPYRYLISYRKDLYSICPILEQERIRAILISWQYLTQFPHYRIWQYASYFRPLNIAPVQYFYPKATKRKRKSQHFHRSLSLFRIWRLSLQF